MWKEGTDLVIKRSVLAEACLRRLCGKNSILSRKFPI